MPDLIESLVERQKLAGESDPLFARRLGVSRQAWQKLRTRERQMGRRALAGVLRAYPDLSVDVNSFLSGVKQGAV